MTENDLQKLHGLLTINEMLARTGGLYPTMQRIVAEELVKMEELAKAAPVLVASPPEEDDE